MMAFVKTKIKRGLTFLEVIAHIAILFTIISMATGLWGNNMP